MSVPDVGVPAAVEKPGTRLALRIFLPFACAYFLSYVFRTVNSIIAPYLVADTGIDAAGLGLLTSAFLLAFALAQIPLGLLLDRFGPRRVEATLLLCAAAGSLLFAVGERAATLTLARALIGLGMSGCMMAAFKAFVLWFPVSRLPFVNGCLLALGSTGALAATAPVEWILGIIDWRTLFVGFALVTLAVAVMLLAVVPERRGPPARERIQELLAGLRVVFRDRLFWRIAPPTLLSLGTFVSMQGLWAGPWLRDVAGLDRNAVAMHLLGLGFAIVTGYLLSGTLVVRLTRRGIEPLRVAVTGMTLFVVVQIGLLLSPPELALAGWIAFGLTGAAGTIPYAALSQHFHGRLSGRANTALNLLVFVAAFVAQWGFGMLLSFWENPVTHAYGAAGYRWGFMILIVLQVLGLMWYALSGKRE